ncbi:hypothetical protein T492DRAFT_950227 [Pavlovales sp. CCMP2436]|nr:hypothetical protein T492DRAFT_950227 [Pavlovales sp. CCMP2436]
MAQPAHWSISYLRSELVLLVNGRFVDSETVIKKHAGTDFTLQVGKHFLAFRSSESDPASATIAINGGATELFEFRGSLHVYATPLAVVFQQSSTIPWPVHGEPRTGPPTLGSWVTIALAKEVISPAGVVKPSTAAFARSVRLVGILFCSSQNELSQKFVRRLEICYRAGLMLDAAIIAVTVESTAEEAAATRATLPPDWASLPFAQTGRAWTRYGILGTPALVFVEALSGTIVRANAVVDVMANANEPATVLKLCGVEKPACWAREQAKRRAASSRLTNRVSLKPEELLSAFRSADVDQSDSVSLGELRGAFRTLGLPVSQSTLRLFRESSSNSLDFVEFCVLASQCRHLLQPRDAERRRLLAIFAESDVEQFGFVGMDTMVGCLARAGIWTNAETVTIVIGRPIDDCSEFDFPEFSNIFERLQLAAAEPAKPQ